LKTEAGNMGEPTQDAQKSKRRLPVNHGVRVAFGKKLREARKAKNLSIRKLHDLTGVAYTFLSKVERGQSGISIDTAALLASKLGIPLWELLRTVSEEDPDE